MPRVLAAGSLAVLFLVAGATGAAAQAWVPPAHIGSVTFVIQTIDHVGRLRNDGSRLAVGQATNVGIDLDVEYALTDRWSISGGMPYVLGKYRGGPPPPFLPYLQVDACHCWTKDWQDVEFASRYNLVNVNRAFMLTPSLSVSVPSHHYDYVGEAVVGRRLTELRIGADAGQRLDSILRGLTAEGRYTYTIVPRVLDIPNNRSNGSFEGSLPISRHVAVRGIALWQRTHGGLRMPIDIQGFPERYPEFHRMLRDNYLQVGAGVSYGRGAWDLSTSYFRAARGSNSHDVHVFTVTIGRLFEAGGRR